MDPMMNPPALVVRAEKETTAALLARLRDLGQEAGERLYDRVALAARVLADDQWVRTFRSFDLALKMLKVDYFPDLKGTSEFDLDHLLALLEEFPAKDQWREQKWSVKKLWAEHELRHSRPKEPPRSLEPAREVPPSADTRVGQESLPEPTHWQTAGYTPAAEEAQTPSLTEMPKYNPERELIARLQGENLELKRTIRKLRKKTEKLEEQLREARLKPGC